VPTFGFHVGLKNLKLLSVKSQEKEKISEICIKKPENCFKILANNPFGGCA
jgi:hypothetical protein